MTTLNSLNWVLLVGGFAGFLAGKIMRGRGYGVIGDVLLGIFGGILGGFLFVGIIRGHWCSGDGHDRRGRVDLARAATPFDMSDAAS